MLLQVQGHEVYCYTGGKALDTTLPAIVFIHGAQNDHSVWGLQSRYFANHGYAVLAPDLPAHARSKGHPLPSVPALRDWLLGLMDAAGLARVALVGHSMGALVALDTAAAAPARITRLAMLGVAWPMKVSQQLLDAALHDEPRAIAMVNTWSHSTLAPKPAAPGPGFWVQGMSARLMERISAGSGERVFHTDLLACDSYAGGAAAAAAVSCPALFMLGRADAMTPAKGAASLRSALPGAALLSLACGHAMMAEQPDEVLDGLKAFLAPP